MRTEFVGLGLLMALTALAETAKAQPATAADEFRINREAVFEFVQKPTLAVDGDRATVSFESKGLCDTTVAIEDDQGRIIRHFAYGVLGPKAPPPFQKDARKQTLVWDCKDDLGNYVADKSRVSVRVSLGLKAVFERQFRWSPHRRIGALPPLFIAAPEGVYVFDGHGVDYLRLFDHAGNYIRTIYPFPADKLGKVEGVKQHTFPQSGKTLPLKWGFYESTLLTSGFSGMWGDYMLPRDGPGATAMAVRGSRIALACLRVNRLATDGTTGGLPLDGPETSFVIDRKWYAVPRSAAISPDGKTLYVTGFAYDKGYDHGNQGWIHGVGKVDLDAGKKMEVFAGSLEIGRQFGGSDPGKFKSPSSVDVDPQGRVYVSDHFNDRVQVFDASGKHLKNIEIFRPSEVCVDQKTGHIYVFSWMYYGEFYDAKPVKPTLTRLKVFDDPQRLASWPLPMRDQYTELRTYADRAVGFQYRGMIDSWTPGDDGPNVWLLPGAAGGRALAIPGFSDSAIGGSRFETTDKNGNPLPDRWAATSIVVLHPKGEKLDVVREFGRDSTQAMLNVAPTNYWRDRLYVRPTTGRLYVLGSKLIEIDPETGREADISLPFSPEDMAFDIDGRAYLRTHTDVVRYDPTGWREVPFDYGEERSQVGVWNGRKGGAVAALPIPTQDIWHQGGMSVSPKKHLAVAFYSGDMTAGREERGVKPMPAGKPWKPQVWPGRAGKNIIFVWDAHGKLIFEDAVPGLGITDGIGIDKDDNLYMMAAATRMFGKERYWDYMTGTVIKVRPKTKVLSRGGPIELDAPPDRLPDTADGQIDRAWYEGAEWFYGGVGFSGKDGVHAMGGCACWNGRFALDYFGRSFAPETQHYSVAVLDSAGNLVMRIGQYGNVEDGVPLVTSSSPAVPARRKLGGDEVGLFYPVYLATHSDHRLFIADPGNQRIVSVKLDYHASETVALSGARPN